MPRPAIDPEAAGQHLSANCTVMAGLVAQHGRCTLMDRDYQPFESLAASIVGQQLSAKAADTIEKRARRDRRILER
jgi:DNA-3-methyladenine glycosylase II